MERGIGWVWLGVVVAAWSIVLLVAWGTYQIIQTARLALAAIGG